MTTVLITTHNPGLDRSDFLRTGNIVHAPKLSDAPADRLLDALVRHSATALIASHRPHDALLRQWSGAVPGAKFLAYALGLPTQPTQPGHPDIAEFRQDDCGLDSIAHALRRCELHFTRNRPVQPAAFDHNARDVVLVGAGIVNLVTALYLADHGYHLTVLDRSPEPGGADWRRYGCTHAGDDARMFTFTEMDNYSNQDFHAGPSDRFRVGVDRLGWLAHDPWSASAQERAWVAEFEHVPSWLARAYNDDIFAFTTEAHHAWTALRRDHPGLFEDVVLTDGILRVYSDQGHLAASLNRHRRIGAVTRELTPTELARDFPALAAPLRDGGLTGGFLVPGFTLNVHKFARRIIDHLQARAVVFRWDTEVSGARRDTEGVLVGFDGPVPQTVHVVASPGVHGGALLDGTPCAGKIHGVLGGWVRIGNRGPRLGTSLKVGRKGHVTEDANVTVATDGDGNQVLIVGSGYGYLADPANPVDERQLAAVRRGIMDTVERLFPGRGQAPESSHAADNYGFKFCIRPWTATSLGLYHAETTAHGRLFVINGGHNTGGFAQSPAIARAVLASLRGEPHPMHALYHPDRFPAFTSHAATGPAAPAGRVLTPHS